MSVTPTPADRYFIDLAPDDTPLDAVAAEIRAEHSAAERAQHAALEHARHAGAQLIAAKARLPHGQFKPFVRDECQMPHSTANLYMKVARRWDELIKSQPVATLTLRAAAKFLSNGTQDDDTEEKADALYALGVLSPNDLRELSEPEVIALVREVRAAYIQCCIDIDADGLAERIARFGPDGSAYEINRRFLATRVRNVAEAMRQGLCTPGQVRKRLGVIPIDTAMRKSLEGRAAYAEDAAGGAAEAKTPAATRSAAAPISAAPYRHALDVFLNDAKEFAQTSATLLTSTHGLYEERVILSPEDRQRLLDRLDLVREAIGKMEAQARRSGISAA